MPESSFPHAKLYQTITANECEIASPHTALHDYTPYKFHRSPFFCLCLSYLGLRVSMIQRRIEDIFTNFCLQQGSHG